ncbi:hypothetical protein D3C85_1681570 [compost metagenome]
MFQPLTFFTPVATNFSIFSSPSFMASRTAALCSSERSLNSKVLPGPMPMRASLARSSLSSGVMGTY